jgi:hypothetical protein
MCLDTPCFCKCPHGRYFSVSGRFCCAIIFIELYSSIIENLGQLKIRVSVDSERCHFSAVLRLNCPSAL